MAVPRRVLTPTAHSLPFVLVFPIPAMFRRLENVTPAHKFHVWSPARTFATLLIFTGFLAGTGLAGSLAENDNATLSLDIAAPEAVVLRAVQEVSNDGIVHGTYVYEKDKTLTGAQHAESSNVLTPAAAGKTIYKVANGVIAPRFFKNSQDIGSITVRYNLQAVSQGSTRLVIDAVFVEDGRRERHPSAGVVENSEFEAVQQQVRKIIADQTPHSPPAKAEVAASHVDALPLARPEPVGADNAAAEQQLRERINELKHKVEVRSKSSTALKSAPFQGATTLVSLPPNSEVVVLVITPYWYGVETTDGRHGWIHKSQLEPLP